MKQKINYEYKTCADYDADCPFFVPATFALNPVCVREGFCPSQRDVSTALCRIPAVDLHKIDARRAELYGQKTK